MSIPSTVKTQLTALQAQTTAANPLNSASGPTLVAIQLNAENLLSAIDTALTGAAGQLDNLETLTDPVAIINYFLALVVSATDQSNLATIEGYVGRAVLNLNQLL